MRVVIVSTAAQAWIESQFRESRDRAGRLNFLSGKARLEVIRAMPVVEVESGITKTIGELYE